MAAMADESNPSAPVPGPPKGGPKMIDVQGMIRQASHRVSVDELVKKGRKTISMLSREKIDELINQADRKSTRLNSSHSAKSRMPSSA